MTTFTILLKVLINSDFLPGKMAASAGGQITLSSTVQLHGVACSRNWKLVKFCNGEVMGRKLVLKSAYGGSTKDVRHHQQQQHICMSLTADVSTESKVYLCFFSSSWLNYYYLN